VKRRPSEYLKDHVRLTSQPIEQPDDDRKLLTMLELMDAENLLMFSSDYPHWDFDSPAHALPKLPENVHRRIFETNARAWYGL
jgi:predicted TIM-barrel fold metal-dependent hydrolase